MNHGIKLIASTAALLAFSASIAVADTADKAHPAQGSLTLAITMTNDPAANQIKVYDVSTHTLLQTLPTNGAGGAGGNAFGVRQLDNELFAAVNNGSQSVAIFRRNGDHMNFDRTVATTSAPVSIDFGNDHMYVAGATSVDSFPIRGHRVGSRDGSALLQLVGGIAPPNGSTAQVGVLDDSSLLVTLKTDPIPGTVDIVALNHGAIAFATPKVVSAPAGTLTPFGFAVYSDGTAVITLAHSNQIGLFRDNAFTSVIGSAGQTAPCWMVRTGKYVYSVNAGSRTISRVVGTGNNIFVDAAVAGTVTTGGPSDVDASPEVLGVIDHAGGASHLTLFALNEFGELSPLGAAIDLGTANANGIAIMSPPEANAG